MVITSIVQSLLPSYLPRWGLRSMWELAAVLNFHHVPGFGNDLSSDDPTVGHPLYCEIRQVEVKKVKATGSGKTVAINLDEFQEVSVKLFQSRSRTESSLGKKLKFKFLMEIEKIHKRLLKKQHREALLPCSFVTADGVSTGHFLRDGKPVMKRQCSAVNVVRRSVIGRPDVSTNGKSNGCWHNNDTRCSKSNYYEEINIKHQDEPLDHSNKWRIRPQKYSEKDFVDTVCNIDAGLANDDDIVGAVYDEEYLRSQKQ
ncbi:atp-dependent rna helicase [Musa troglodytarum]|uniref:Atp-dependent rna helicase n=1 Tax=Musa troglodytarum TaxID=320322 RepID=A0A9E7GB47_9LILI|nr:atp-dependent rna helicase [Musa troglodytarum]